MPQIQQPKEYQKQTNKTETTRVNTTVTVILFKLNRMKILFNSFLFDVYI